MDIEEALEWVAKNCTDETTLQRLKSRRVAKTLADEVQRLRRAMRPADEGPVEREAFARWLADTHAPALRRMDADGAHAAGYAAGVAAEREQLRTENAELRRLLARYRDETPLGHQPHMIAHQVDEALGRGTNVGIEPPRSGRLE